MYTEEGKTSYSSAIGGIITIICGLIILSIAIVAINGVI
jgi:hypothetical protein